MSETTTQDLCASCGHVEDDHDGYGGLCDGLGYSTSRTVCGCAEFIAFATPTSSPSGEPTPLLSERYWCGCVREARWSRCAAHASLDHDDEPPTQRAAGLDTHRRSLMSLAEEHALRRRLSEVEAERDRLDVEGDEYQGRVDRLERWQRQVLDVLACDGDRGPLGLEHTFVRIAELRAAESALSTARLQLQEAKQEVEAWKSVADLAREHNRLDDISGFVARDKRRTLKARIVEAACLASSRSSGVPDGG